jgi:quinol monooxygenase YgiN
MDTTATPAFIINTTYRIEKDDVDAFAALAAQMAKDGAKREGCIFLHAAQDILDHSRFHLVEGWKTQEAFDSHIASDEFQGVLHQAMQLRIAERFGDVLMVSGLKKLEMPT